MKTAMKPKHYGNKNKMIKHILLKLAKKGEYKLYPHQNF